MKKIVASLLMLVYGLSSTGATLQLNYCCGKLDNISFSSNDKKTCFEKSVSTRGCCDSKNVELKVKGDQEPGAKNININQDISAPVFSASYLLEPARKIPVNQYSTGPPLVPSTVALFLKNGVFRI